MTTRSGILLILQIFNAHPALYWGEVSNFVDPALSITAQRTEGGASRGINTVASYQFDTTFPLRFLLLCIGTFETCQLALNMSG